MTLLTQYLY